MSDLEEGIFGWVTINFLLNKLSTPGKNMGKNVCFKGLLALSKKFVTSSRHIIQKSAFSSFVLSKNYHKIVNIMIIFG